MTPDQRKRLYFPAFSKVAAKYDWKMVKGRLVCDLVALRDAVNGWQEETAREVMLNVLRYAETFARQEHQAVTVDNLRHACNFVAAKVTSSDQLTGKELQRVISLFELLRSPMDIEANMRWNDPEYQERQDLTRQITKLADEPTIRAVCRNSSFDRSNWRDLPTSGLLWLRRTLLQRNQRPSWVRNKARDPENEPF